MKHLLILLAASALPAWCALRGQEFVGQPAPGEFVVRRLR